MFSRIAIVGSGALGCYYGTKLALAGTGVCFLMRSDLAEVRRRGTIILHESGRTLELKAEAFGSAEEIGVVDLVIVTLKATANAQLKEILPPLIGPETVILTLQNGLGSDELLAGFFGAGRIMGGLAFIAATRTGPAEVSCFHPGSITLGEFSGGPKKRTQELGRQFESAGIRIRIAESLLEARWSKLVWNIPFNGLSIASGGLSTDRLCADPLLGAEIRTLMKEVQAAAAGFGFSISDEFLRQQFDVTPPMGAYQPSSLVDFLAGREVEVDAIWGEPLRRAQARGVALPRISMLHALLTVLAGPASRLRSAGSGR